MSNDSQESGRTRRDLLLGELLWLVPVGAAAFLLAVAVYKNAHSQELVATVGVLLAAAALIVAWLIHRLQIISRSPSGPRVTLDRRWHYLSYFLAIVLIAVAFVGIPGANPTADDPKIYLAKGKKVRIGINGRLPGWSSQRYGDPAGFDIELASFLQREYGFTPEFVDLTQNERLHQWDGTQQTANKEPVDLVISTVSITPLRLENFDMAGPYYLDVTLTWRNADKPDKASDGKSHGCAVKGTTGAEEMDRLRKVRDQTDPGKFIVEPLKDRLEECIVPFFNNGSDIQYIGSDWSILRAFDPTVTVTAAEGGPEVVDPQQPRPENQERYGIAFRNDHPNLCKALTEEINKFLAGGSPNGSWDEAFDASLQKQSIVSSWHKPAKSDPGYCGR